MSRDTDAVIGFAIIAAVVLALLSLGPLIFMAAWNYVMPVFWAGAPHIGFWHALAAVIILGFIGGIFRGSRS